jgi:hypothetical protein
MVDDAGDESDRLICGHLGTAVDVPEAGSACEDCLREGTRWVHLRQCLVCGGTRCCDNSPRRHATGHWRTSGHALVRSGEPDEIWGWCYPDQVVLVPADVTG